MLNAIMVLSASANPGLEGMRLFTGPTSRAGIVVIGIVAGGLLVWMLAAVIKSVSQKRLEKLPTILGRPKQLLEQVGSAAQLTVSQKYLLNRLAYRLNLPQPTSIMISPILLVKASQLWSRTHRAGPVRQWGLNRLDELAKRVYQHDLRSLAEQLDVDAPIDS